MRCRAARAGAQRAKSVQPCSAYKLISFRARDRQDIADVIKTAALQGEALDCDQIETWARVWDVLDRWDRIRRTLDEY